MGKYISKKPQIRIFNSNFPKDKSIKRFWGNAARLEHRNVRNKNKSKKRI